MRAKTLWEGEGSKLFYLSLYHDQRLSSFEYKRVFFISIMNRNLLNYYPDYLYKLLQVYNIIYLTL